MPQPKQPHRTCGSPGCARVRRVCRQLFPSNPTEMDPPKSEQLSNECEDTTEIALPAKKEEEHIQRAKKTRGGSPGCMRVRRSKALEIKQNKRSTEIVLPDTDEQQKNQSSETEDMGLQQTNQLSEKTKHEQEQIQKLQEPWTTLEMLKLNEYLSNNTTVKVDLVNVKQLNLKSLEQIRKMCVIQCASLGASSAIVVQFIE